MNSLEVNKEIYQCLAKLSDDEAYMRKVAAYLKKLLTKKEQTSNARTDSMSNPDLNKVLEEGEKQIEEGRFKTFDSAAELVSYLEEL